MQEATLDAKEEVVGIAKLVEQTTLYFGSQEALRKFGVDERFAGRKALEEVRVGPARG